MLIGQNTFQTPIKVFLYYSEEPSRKVLRIQALRAAGHGEARPAEGSRESFPFIVTDGNEPVTNHRLVRADPCSTGQMWHVNTNTWVQKFRHPSLHTSYGGTS